MHHINLRVLVLVSINLRDLWSIWSTSSFAYFPAALSRVLHFAEGWNTKQLFHLTGPPHRIVYHTSPSAFIVWTASVRTWGLHVGSLPGLFFSRYFTTHRELVQGKDRGEVRWRSREVLHRWAAEMGDKFKWKRGPRAEEQKGCNCEIGRGMKREETREGGVKTHVSRRIFW